MIVDPQKLTEKFHFRRILKLRYSEHTTARSAETKTKKRIYKRPIVRLEETLKVNIAEPYLKLAVDSNLEETQNGFAIIGDGHVNYLGKAYSNGYYETKITSKVYLD